MNLTPAQMRTLEMLAVHRQAEWVETVWRGARSWSWVIDGQQKSRTVEALRAVGLIDMHDRTARLSDLGRRVVAERGLMSQHRTFIAGRALNTPFDIPPDESLKPEEMPCQANPKNRPS